MENRPAEVTISTLLPDRPKGEIPPDIPAWVGGPVGTENGLIIHNQGINERDGICLTSSEDALKQLVSIHKKSDNGDALGCRYPYRFLFGYYFFCVLDSRQWPE